MGKEKVILTVEGLNKSFGPTKAVVNMHLEIRSGEIHGLIGENGSGKSTVTSMIAGCLQPDSGKMLMEGKPHCPKNMIDGRRSGICMLLQEKGTIDHLTVAENIFLGEEDQFGTKGIINRREMNKAAVNVLTKIELQDVEPAMLIDELSFEDRKLIEAGMAMKENPKILIVDETTTALSQKGREVIYKLIREMKEKGDAVIFISHDLEQLKSVCDIVTVMRDGEYITTLTGKEITVDSMRKNMIGRELTGGYYRQDYEDTSDHDKVVLEAKHICLGNRLNDVSLKLHKGEVLGIGGLTDCGMHDLIKVMFGLLKPDSGKVVLTEQNIEIKSPEIAVRNKMGYIPKDRESEGLMLAASIRDNINMMSMDKIKKGFLITPHATTKLAKEQVKMLSIKIGGLNLPVSSLSGGNKQKVAIAKCTANDVQIVLMDCPTRGIDIGVKAAIYRLLEQFKREGRSVLMVSEELPELIGMSDNLLIMRDGRITGKIKRSSEVSESDVINKMI